MWPFRRKPKVDDVGLAACLDGAEPRKVSCEVTVVSPNAIRSPITGAVGAGFWVEVFEQLTLDDVQPDAEGPTNPYVMSNTFRGLTSRAFGGTLGLRSADGTEISVDLHRARLALARGAQAPTPVAPRDARSPELASLLEHVGADRVPFVREQVIRDGDRFRLSAIVEAVRDVARVGYRSGVGTSLVVRYDLGAVDLEELLDVPAW